MASWKWNQDGKSVEIVTDSRESFTFETATVKDTEWNDFLSIITEEGGIYKTLQSAQKAFTFGQANYEGARDNLRNLIREGNASMDSLLRKAQDIDAFFTKLGIVKAFGKDAVGLIEFVLDFTARAYTRAPGNGE